MFKSFISRYPFLGVIRQKPKNTKEKTTLTANYMYFIYTQSDQPWVRLASFPARFAYCFLSFVISSHEGAWSKGPVSWKSR